MFASSFYVSIEPAPCDLLFLVVLASFLASGLTISAAVVPLVLFLLLYNLGGFFSFLQVTDDQKAMMFVITSFYMAFSAVFFAFYVAHDPLAPHGYHKERARHRRSNCLAPWHPRLFQCCGSW